MQIYAENKHICAQTNHTLIKAKVWFVINGAESRICTGPVNWKSTVLLMTLIPH